MIDQALIAAIVLIYTGAWVYVAFQWGRDEGRRDVYRG
jgi:hypothetical protein